MLLWECLRPECPVHFDGFKRPALYSVFYVAVFACSNAVFACDGKIYKGGFYRLCRHPVFLMNAKNMIDYSPAETGENFFHYKNESKDRKMEY